MKCFDIDGQKLKVLEVEDVGEAVEGYPLGGDYDPPGTIRVSRYNSRRGRRAVLIHELQHHFFDRSGLRRRLRRKFGRSKGIQLEELICDELSGWWMVTRDSAPELLRELFDL